MILIPYFVLVITKRLLLKVAIVANPNIFCLVTVILYKSALKNGIVVNVVQPSCLPAIV